MATLTGYNGKAQMWQKGVMMSVISESEANELIESGTYRRINNQAIDYITMEG